MTTDQLKDAIAGAVEALDSDERTRLTGAVTAGEIDDPACCAAQVLAGGDSEYDRYAQGQRRALTRERLRLIHAGHPDLRTMAVPEVMIARGEDVEPWWVLEWAYEGWFPSVPRETSEALLREALTDG